MTRPLDNLPPRPPDARRLRYIIGVGLGLCLVIMLLVGGLSVRAAELTRDNTATVTHTFAVLDLLDDILGWARDAETGSRGFALTGKENFLEPYDTALEHLQPSLARLSALFDSSDAGQLRRVHDLDSLVGVKLRFIQRVATTRRTRGLREAAALVETERGKQVMDSIRRVVADIELTEQVRMQRGEAALTRAEDETRNAIMAAAILAVVVVILAMVAVLRDLAGRQRADEALRRSEAALRRSEEQLLQWVVGRGGPSPPQPR